MAGLSLAVGGYGGLGQGTMPTAASQPGAASVTQQAFGVYSSQTAGGPSTAAYGSLIAGAAAAALIVFLWHSLPR